MSLKSDSENPDLPMYGQTPRVGRSSRSAALHDQLYRYAEDLHQLIERNGTLEAHYAALRNTCETLTESRDELDRLLHASRDIHVVTDPFGVIVQTNPSADKIAAPQKLTGHKLESWVEPAYLGSFLAMQSGIAADDAASGNECELHLRSEAPDAPTMIVIARVLGIRRHGALHFLHWIFRDVTYLRETEFETKLSSMVFKSSGEGIIITDVEGEILAVNPAFSRITGYTAAEAVGKNPRILNSGVQTPEFYAGFWRALREDGVWQGEIYNRRKSGEIYPEWLHVTTVRDNDGQVLSYIAVLSDLSRLLAAEKQLSFLAHYDALTGLPNRHLFGDRLDRAIAQSRRAGQGFCLVFIDLDDFKPINDTHGHVFGDSVLKEVATRLLAGVRESDTVARLGGDEFVVIAPALSGEAEIGRFCAKLIDAVGRPMCIEDRAVQISASFGCAVFPDHGKDGLELLKGADTAMYRAKQAGAGRYALLGPLPRGEGLAGPKP